ncbi:UNVERIFIED_CONTAM: hypothetical protein FKN15_021048 [Acipenser sinensis]
MASIMEGPLSKWTNVMKGWQYRWFVLDYNAGLLSYYTSKDKMMRGSRRGCVRLQGAVIGIDDEDDSTFTITVDQKTFHFQARDADEREKWIHALEGTILRHTLQLREAETEFVPSVQDFDKKLAEADAYLQILIDQLKLFDEKIRDCKEDEQRRVRSGPSAPSSSVTSPSHVNLSSNTVPDFSYSSSEDEFYDADEFYQTSTSPKRCIDPSMTPAVLPHSSTGSSLKRPDTNESLNSSMSNGTTDADQFDSHDDRDDDGEGESVEEHKSVIMHLLSQVRLGMDLTKVRDQLFIRTVGSGDAVSEPGIAGAVQRVVLPTFILERRSLLEMYADFFAHPDLFVSTCLMHFCDSIADQTDPRDRMVQVLKWYLSAFHAGRKGSVAKKPYNPILGEIFLCYWDLPSDNEETAEPVSEGPAPWCSKNDVSFVAEQVSHHPPISAFYAECYSKKIQFNAHIWTKSKFLGMSIGVHNIGQGCVSCLEYDEHYILTFPNGYGRSILTVPWVELGGECTISCSQTGYSASVSFHTKPFYGGKKHRITAEIFLWKDVTVNLKLRDIDAATEAKHSLEEKQRAEARERKEKEMQWETRLFHEDGECWVYDEPLLKRMAAKQ